MTMSEILSYAPVLGALTAVSAAMAAVLDVRRRLVALETRLAKYHDHVERLDDTVTEIRLAVARIEARCFQIHRNDGEA